MSLDAPVIDKPERKHLSDAAWIAYTGGVEIVPRAECEKFYAEHGIMWVTVEEWDAGIAERYRQINTLGDSVGEKDRRITELEALLEAALAYIERSRPRFTCKPTLNLMELAKPYDPTEHRLGMAR